MRKRMWTRLKLFILTATPTAILYALWLFSRRPKQKPPQNAIKPSTDQPQIVPIIEVTDVESDSRNDVKSRKEVADADPDGARWDSETEVNSESQNKVNHATLESSAKATDDDDCSLTNSDLSTSRNDAGVAALKSQVDSSKVITPDGKTKPESEVAGFSSHTKVNNTTRKTGTEDVAVDSVLQVKVTSDDVRPGVEASDIECNSQMDGCNVRTQSVTERDIQQLEKCFEGIESGMMSRNVGEGGRSLTEDWENVEKVVQRSAVPTQTSAMVSENSPQGASFTSGNSQSHQTQSEDLETCDDIRVKAAAQMENGTSSSSVSSPHHKSRLDSELSVGQVTENGLESIGSVRSVESNCLSNAVTGSENSESGCDYVSESGSETQDKYAVAAQRQLGEGVGGENPDGEAEKSRVVYQFDFPSDLCGRLIGKQGRNVLSIREKSGADIVVKNKLTTTTFRVVVLEGTKRQVTLALRLIKSKFPESRYPNVNYTQTVPEELLPPTESIMQLNLPMGVRMDVIVSRVIAANHVFVQQPSHPTFPHLELQMQMMLQCYDGDAQTPHLPQPYEVGVVCVALIDSYWYRVQVISVYTESDECDVKLVDYGGYVRVPGTALKQIRRDFTTLPFQAIECYLFGVISPSDEEDFPPESASVLVELVSGSILQAEAVAVEEDQVPYILLTKLNGSQSKFINRELVNRGVARWLEQ